MQAYNFNLYKPVSRLSSDGLIIYVKTLYNYFIWPRRPVSTPSHSLHNIIRVRPVDRRWNTASYADVPFYAPDA